MVKHRSLTHEGQRTGRREVNQRVKATAFATLSIALLSFLWGMFGVAPVLAQSDADLEVRWSQIPSPALVGDKRPVGVGMAGNGHWITSRAYIDGNSQKGLSANAATGSRFFGDPESVERFNDINFYYSTLTEIDGHGTIYALFNQASVGKITAKGSEVYIGTKALGEGMAAYNASLAKDLGVNDDGALWRIGVEKAPGGYVVDRYDTAADTWERISGGAVKVDVDPQGLPWVANDQGAIWHWSGNSWQAAIGKARDIAVGSDGVVWIISSEGTYTGRPCFLRSWDAQNGKTEWHCASDLPADFGAVNIAAGRHGEALVSDNRGRLWRSHPDVRDPELDVTSTGTFDLAKATDIGKTGPVTAATSQADRANLDMMNGGAISLWFQIGAAAVATKDATVLDAETFAFVKQGLGADADATLAEIGIVEGTGSEGCLLSHGSSNSTKFSLCLDGTLTNLAVTIGKQVVNVPVSGLSGVPQNLLVRAASEGPDKDMVLRVWLNGMALGPWFLEKQSRVDPDGRTTVRIGADAEGERKFRGSIGGVRVWADPVDPAAVSAAPFVQRASSPALPGYPVLVLDAPLTPEQPSITLMPPSIVPERFWHTSEIDTFKPVIRPPTKASLTGAEGNFVMPDLYRVRLNPPKSPGVPATMTIFRDGEGGYTEATFVQTARNSYHGARSPVTDEAGSFDVTLEKTSVRQTYNAQVTDRTVPVTTMVIGADRLYSVSPFVDNPEKAAVSDSFAFQSMASLAAYNYHGQDVTQMSPLPGRASKQPKSKIFHMFDPSDERSREYTVQPPVVIPWGTNYFQIEQGGVVQKETVAKTTREFQDGFGFSLGASVEVPEVAEFSANGAFKTSTEKMIAEERTAIYSNGWYAYYALVADRARLSLDEKFLIDVQDLKDGRMKPAQFFSIYGTHYAHAVTYGQRIRFQTIVSKKALSTKLEKEWKVGQESKAAIEGVVVGLKSEFEKSDSSTFEKENEARDSFAYGEAGGISNSLEEIMVGDNANRVTPVAYDLRPIWELFSPLYFDDPAIYRDLRSTMQTALYTYAMRDVNENVLNDVNLMPSILRVQLQRLVPVAAGDGAFYGKVEIVEKDRNGKVGATKVIWNVEKDEAVKADLTAGGKRAGYDISGAFADFVGTESDLEGKTFELRSTMHLADSTDVLTTATTTLQVADFSEAGVEPPLVSGKACTCLSACPTGYTADGGTCVKNCPDGFITRGGTCYGSYEAKEFYRAWNMAHCESDWGVGQCEHLNELFGEVVPKCGPGFFRVFGTYGICIADCEQFGLEKWAGGNATCLRPEAERTSQPMATGGSCPAGTERSNKSCPSIELEYQTVRLN